MNNFLALRILGLISVRNYIIYNYGRISTPYYGLKRIFKMFVCPVCILIEFVRIFLMHENDCSQELLKLSNNPQTQLANSSQIQLSQINFFPAAKNEPI